MLTDWLMLKNEYITTSISYRKLAEKYEVSFATLQKKALKDNWKKQRDKQRDKLDTKIRQKLEAKVVKNEVNRLSKIMSISDELIRKIDIAVGQLENYTVAVKATRKVTNIDNNRKNIVESTEQSEEIKIVNGLVDRLGLKHIVSALKEIADMQLSLESISKKDNEKSGAVDKLIATLGGRAVEGENDD